MKILIIGGTGLISSAITRCLLERGDDLTLCNRGISDVLIPAGAKIVRCDRRDHAAFEAQMVELDPPPANFDQRPFCAIATEAIWVVYLPKATGQVILTGIEPRAWQARWFDPRTGETSSSGAVDVGADRKWRAPRAPTGGDWVLLVSAGR